MTAYEIVAHILRLPEGSTIFFEEMVEKLARENAESLLVRIVPLFPEHKSIIKKIFSTQQVQGYGLAFGSASESYGTTHQLKDMFEQYFGMAAEKKLEELFIPLVRILLRKKIAIPGEILSSIEERKLFWLEKRKLGRHMESIVYFVFMGKLIRIDSERENVTAHGIGVMQEKITSQYPQLSTRSSQTFSLHEIHLTDGKSLLLPNDDELLSDVDKAKIRNALLATSDTPQKFAQKLEVLLAFRIPLLSRLKQEETHLYPHILQGSVFDFIVALNSVVRWSRQPEEVIDTKTGEKSIRLTFQDSLDPKKKETDLDHTITMLSMASQIFTLKKYAHLAKELDEAAVMNDIFVHDGGEPFSPFGDVTHADEERWQTLRQSKNEAENAAYMDWWQQRIQLKNVKDEVLHDLYGSFTTETNKMRKEEVLVKFLDHFQAVIYGIENIYPYETVYKDEEKLKDYVQKYALRDLVTMMQTLSGKAREELRNFFVDQLPFSSIESSYRQAVEAKRIEKSLADKLIDTIKQTLSIVHKNTDAKKVLDAYTQQMKK